MQVPLELTFRKVEPTQVLERYIRGQVSKLHRFSRDIVGCRVVVERREEHQRAGNPFHVRVEVSLPPGKYLVAAKEPMDHEMHAPLRTVIRSTFAAMERQVKDVVELRRGDVKTHEGPRAMVVRIFPEQGYGFLQTADGRDLYFHRNAVLHDDFDHLAAGTEVRFEETEGEQGPQASTVQIVAKQAATPAPDAVPPTPKRSRRPRKT
jgi:cold shock CspA family protein/ribosome-associated translation inhibitor RaiA